MNGFARAERLPVPVSAAASYRLAAYLGLVFGAIVASGQEAAIQKIVMTGDAVPGLEEDFAFFRAVHLFEDGEVGFAGITTRTGSFKRSPGYLSFEYFRNIVGNRRNR